MLGPKLRFATFFFAADMAIPAGGGEADDGAAAHAAGAKSSRSAAATRSAALVRCRATAPFAGISGMVGGMVGVKEAPPVPLSSGVRNGRGGGGVVTLRDPAGTPGGAVYVEALAPLPVPLSALLLAPVPAPSNAGDGAGAAAAGFAIK